MHREIFCQLEHTASLFDEATEVAAQRRDFLKALSARMILPVMPENQDHNYLITQVVAHYLAMHPSASIDGIIYPSVQVNGGDVGGAVANVVLFHKAAIAANADSESDTAEAELWQYDDDGPGEYFRPTILYREVKPPYSFQYDGFRLLIQPVDCWSRIALKFIASSLSISILNQQRLRLWMSRWGRTCDRESPREVTQRDEPSSDYATWNSCSELV